MERLPGPPDPGGGLLHQISLCSGALLRCNKFRLIHLFVWYSSLRLTFKHAWREKLTVPCRKWQDYCTSALRHLNLSGVLVLRASTQLFNMCLDTALHSLLPFSVLRWTPTCAPVGVATCLYIPLEITPDLGFSKHHTVPSRPLLNDRYLCPKLSNNPYPLKSTNLPKFIFRRSKLLSWMVLLFRVANTTTQLSGRFGPDSLHWRYGEHTYGRVSPLSLFSF